MVAKWYELYVTFGSPASSRGITLYRKSLANLRWAVMVRDQTLLVGMASLWPVDVIYMPVHQPAVLSFLPQCTISALPPSNHRCLYLHFISNRWYPITTILHNFPPFIYTSRTGLIKVQWKHWKVFSRKAARILYLTFTYYNSSCCASIYFLLLPRYDVSTSSVRLFILKDFEVIFIYQNIGRHLLTKHTLP